MILRWTVAFLVSAWEDGDAPQGQRKEVYLATKSGMRDDDGTLRELEESLKRLPTDDLDCWPRHNVRTRQDVDTLFAEHGALKAFQTARDETITRFIRITGQGDPLGLKPAIKF